MIHVLLYRNEPYIIQTESLDPVRRNFAAFPSENECIHSLGRLEHVSAHFIVPHVGTDHHEAGVFCTACNTWASGHAQVAALGHSWGDWITDTDPTIESVTETMLDQMDNELTARKEKIEASGMNETAYREAKKVLNRLKHEGQNSAESGMLYDYLDFVTGLSWKKEEPERIGIGAARQSQPSRTRGPA